LFFNQLQKFSKQEIFKEYTIFLQLKFKFTEGLKEGKMISNHHPSILNKKQPEISGGWYFLQVALKEPGIDHTFIAILFVLLVSVDQ